MVRSMVDNASKFIKDRQQKRKQESEEQESASTEFSVGGQQDKFPNKNIKPKKAFLLMGNSSASSSGDESVGRTVKGRMEQY